VVRLRGLHIVAGIVAMGVTAVLGSVMGLNNTAVFTSSCVAYVAVSMWAESRLSRRRGKIPGPVQLQPQVTDPGPLDRAPDQIPRQEGNAA
jgi:hypothetical protein